MNKQEKIQYPDRTAKLLRNSPQLSNLLDSNGEGLLEMEEQQKRQVMEVEKEHKIREMAGPSTGSAADVRATKSKRVFAEQPGGPGFHRYKPPRPEVFSMNVDDNDDNSKKTHDDELDIIYNMDVNPTSYESNPLLYALNSIMPLNEVIAEIDRIEKEGEDRKKNIQQFMARNLGNVVPQSVPILFPSSSSAGAASSSTTPQNMIVDKPDGVKRDNEDDSSKPKTTQRKSGGPSLTKKEKAPLALTNAEQSQDIPKSLDTPKLVKVSKEVFKDIFHSVKKSITNPTTEATPIPPIRKRIFKKSAEPSFTKKEKSPDCSY